MVLGILDKLVGIVHRPIELVADWATEPLKNNEMRRRIEEAKEAGLAQAEVDKMVANYKLDLKIRRETEVARIYIELEQLKQDKELARQKEISEAIMDYQKQLTRMNVDAVNAIGEMQLDLRTKAQALMLEKTQEYRALQTEAQQQARQELIQLNEDFPDAEKHALEREIMMDSIRSRLTSVITAAQHFLGALNDDIRAINTSITVLTENGQAAILEQIARFHLSANGVLSAPERSDDVRRMTSSAVEVSRIAHKAD
jgi:hypothetical protein